MNHLTPPRPADKYSQVYRILLPICNTLSQIPKIAENPALRSYIDDEWGSPEGLSREILEIGRAHV